MRSTMSTAENSVALLGWKKVQSPGGGEGGEGGGGGGGEGGEEAEVLLARLCCQ